MQISEKRTSVANGRAHVQYSTVPLRSLFRLHEFVLHPRCAGVRVNLQTVVFTMRRLRQFGERVRCGSTPHKIALVRALP